MCKFASFVLTKDRALWSSTSDSHEQIIAEHQLRDDAARVLIVRVELTPPADDPRCRDLARWAFRVDQDVQPEWTFAGDPMLEQRTREAAARRAEGERWWQTADGSAPVVGYAGTATAGDAGTATAGYAGTATAGDAGTATAGDAGIVEVRWWDCAANRWRIAIGYVGEDGILPGVAYCVRDGRLVRRDGEP